MTIPPRILIAVFLSATGSQLWAEGGRSALEALAALQTRIGTEASQTLIAMNGQRGQDQPEEWLILTLNQASPNLSQQYLVDRVGVADQGAPAGLYPSDAPPGFIDTALFRVDSVAAFQALNAEATKARVGFNSVDYTLMAREYEKDPIWRLEAIDVKGRTVGSLDLSASNGTVLRSVWYYWDEGQGGQEWNGPRIVDSLLHTAPGAAPAVERPLEPSQPTVSVPPRTTMPPVASRPAETRPPEREKGGLFSRLRRKPLLRSNSPPPPAPAPSPANPTVEVAPVIPLPPGGAGVEGTPGLGDPGPPVALPPTQVNP